MPSCLTATVHNEPLPVSGAARVAPRELTERDRESLGAALGRVPDPRDPRGVRYPVVAMLMVVVCAMLAGARSFAAIGEWCADLDATGRMALGFTGPVPGPVTIWRLLVRIDAPALDEVVNVWTRAYLARVNEAARALALDQRIALRYAMTGMDAGETKTYLIHHLKLAGRSDTLFSDDAAALIHQVSRGLPRAVNNLAVQSLVAAFATNKTIVDESSARAAVTEVTTD